MELRCDFRRYYGCSFDEVEVGECLDLVDGLPDGSLYVRAVYPARAWSERRVLATEIRQTLLDVFEAGHGVPEDKRTRIPRPWDELVREANEKRLERELEQAEKAREYIENQKWEAV